MSNTNDVRATRSNDHDTRRPYTFALADCAGVAVTSIAPREPFVDASRAAEFLCLPRPRLLALARTGELPGHPIGRGSRHSWLFRLSELSVALERKNAEPKQLVYGDDDPNYASTSPERAGKRNVMPRYQMGSLRKESRKAGETWVFRWHTTRPCDGKRVENTQAIGLVKDLGKSLASARREVDRQHLRDYINTGKRIGGPTFGALAATFIKDRAGQLAHTTARTAKDNIGRYLLPRWGNSLATEIRPLDLARWFAELRDGGLASTTVCKIRGNMLQVYRYGQQMSLIKLDDESIPVKHAKVSAKTDYKAVAMTPKQVAEIIGQLRGLERALAILSATTALRISESLGLIWGDIEFERQVIRVKRTWTHGKIGEPKTKASAAAVPMCPALAKVLQEWRATTAYSKANDFVFASDKSHGKRPREGGVASADYLRPAAIKAGVIPEGYTGRFGWHNFRFFVAHHLVHSGTVSKVVQGVMRHADVRITLDLYTQVSDAAGMAALTGLSADIGLIPATAEKGQILAQGTPDPALSAPGGPAQPVGSV